MALINTLRNKGGKIVVFLIGFSIVAFIGADLLGPNSTLLGGNKLNVGEIAGVTISYQDFIDKQEELTYNFQVNQRRSPSSAEQDYIKNQTWDALVNTYAYNQQFDVLGLTVSADELVDMFQGDNISAQVKQAFTDPKTGAFDKESVVGYIGSLSDQPKAQRDSWLSFEKSVMENRLREKYNNLIIKTNYATQAEAEYQYTNSNNTAEVNYIFIPFDDMTETSVSASEEELNAYLSSHADEYESKESKSLKYVVYDVVPSAEDSTLISNQAQELIAEFASAENDSLYAVVNSDGNTPLVTYTESKLPINLQGVELGTVVGPSIENNSYVLYKLSSLEDTTYTVAKVALEIYVTDETRNVVYREAEQLAVASTDMASLEANAKENGLRIKNAQNIDKNAKSISGIAQSRTIVYWAYNKAEVGDVSEVFEINDQYVIAALASEKEEGVADLESVKNEIERKVVNDKKSDIIIEKLNAIEDEVLASKVLAYEGNIAKYFSMPDLKLSSNSLTGVVGLAPEAVGVAFSMEPGETTAPFAIDNGVIIIQLVNKYDAPAISDYEVYRSQVTSKRQSASYYGIDPAVRELADITDERYRFF